MRTPITLLVLLALVFVPWLTTRAEELSDDARVATVLSRQGLSMVRPSAHRRWTPLREQALIMPGDWVRTGARGANALELGLRSGGTLLLGPGALIEIPEGGGVRMLRGEMEIKGAEDAAVAVRGPGDFALEVAGTAWLRATDGRTEPLPEAPRWLTGYRETTGEEWMGSLLANVDGRNVPLAVGYHKVTADIRDQIARTTVEQSFINSTDARLEGTFYFPLPADASISGFGMWIGGELVEADVVERSRARQIYEDILRRKKDPGLLEWQGGNLFKARVFPIEPHSEKRVRIRYTQVLRQEGTTWRYRYALRSDLLRSKPLRRLDIQVNVLSSVEMTGVTSVNHEARVQNTGREARVEIEAEEYVPEKDLEIAVALAATGGLQAVTHRRGDDGYFMLLLTPPDNEGTGWRRDLVPEGDPLDVVIVADTSGSMDAAARRHQATFLEALLSLLGPEDRFRLLASDVEVAQAGDGSQAATEENVAGALAFLEERPSLGWSDLDLAFARATEVAGDGGLVIYVGDGIPTTGDADPTAQAERLRALAADAKATVHAVAPSSTYEQVVLDAMTSIGGGSVRRADTEPAAAAFRLLAEAARPALRDMRVRIDGVPTARVYPEILPNLPLGSQQVLLGRYLPQEGVARGEVVVSGTLDGEAVTFRSALTLPPTDAGNSFLPRLWARKHLDHLLAQGASAEVQADIVAFSAEFGIMTPYTSFLVLESDEDRERYGVTRTVHMRDGETFFAEGRDRVQLEMARKHALAARAWRLDLRRSMIRRIAGLGRDLLPQESIVALGEQAATEGFGFTSFTSGGYAVHGALDRGLTTTTAGRGGGGDLFFGSEINLGEAGVPVDALRTLEAKLESEEDFEEAPAGGRFRGAEERSEWGEPAADPAMGPATPPPSLRLPAEPAPPAADDGYFGPEDTIAGESFAKRPAGRRRARAFDARDKNGLFDLEQEALDIRGRHEQFYDTPLWSVLSLG
ncbi:MAG: VIT domain-containing protein, partial [Planctomycetota bacterium]